jgi:very-short-patch-repair endonuclease
MTARPYRQLKVDDIDRLVSHNESDEVLLRAVLDELSFRSTSKAAVSKRRVEALLKHAPISPPKPSLNSPSPPSSTREASAAAPPSLATETRPSAQDPKEARNNLPQERPPTAKSSPSPDIEAVEDVQPAIQPSRPAAELPKRELSPEQIGVSQLIDYVRTLVELSDKAVWSLSSYNNLLLYECDLRNRIGIRHDQADDDGPIYLKVERLRRIDPPEPPLTAKEWITVGRDPFKQPVIQSIRTTVMTGPDAARLVQAGSIDPVDVANTLKPKPGEDLKDVVLRLSRFPDVQAEIDNYLSQTWATWAQAERPRRETIGIYDRLFSLQQALKLDGSDKPLEVVWGMGVARWKLPPNELDHPLVEQLVELEVDSASAILIRPRGLDPIMALKPFAATENPGTDLVMRFAREHVTKLEPERELSPFQNETFSPILRYACAQLDRSGRYHPDVVPPDDRTVPAATSNLVVTDTWAIYARPRSENFFTSDLERLRQAVEEIEQLPGPAKSLVTEPSDEQTYKPTIRGFGGISGGGSADMPAPPLADAGASAALNKQFYFPKPFNDDQIAIIERLEDPDVEGVVVQGPPGTGKTHTIANIICHYLATGRRVLVTSKSEGALAVLRDQIPAGIRDLAISLLTSEREGLKQLETTVNLLASQVVSLDARPMERNVTESERRIDELGRRIEQIDTEMRSFAEKHLQRLGSNDSTDGILPIELAEKITRDRDRFAWLPDSPDAIASKTPDFGPEEIAAIRFARKTLAGDLAYLGARLPSVSDLPDAVTLTAIHRDLSSAANIERSRVADTPIMSASEADTLSRAQMLLAAVEAIVEVHRLCQDAPWIGSIYNAWTRHGLDAQTVLPLAQLFASLSAPVARRVTVASHAVTAPDEAHANSEVILAIERAASGRKPFGLMPIGKSTPRKVFADIRILGRSPTTPDEWTKVSEYIVWRRDLETELARWQALAPEFGLPKLSGNPDTAAREIHSIMEKINTVAGAVKEHHPCVHTETVRLFPHGLRSSAIISSLEDAEFAADAIRMELSRCRLGSARLKLSATVELLRTSSGSISRAIEAFLTTTVGNPALPASTINDNWTALLTELVRVRALQPHFATIARVADRVAAAGAEKWADRLRHDPVCGVEDPWTSSDWRSAWDWAKAEVHLRAIDGRIRLQELDERRRSSDDEMRRLYNEVVKMRTLLTLKARITRRVDAALQMFLTAIRKIGKGTGKSASRLRRDARDAMEASYAAIPCWIMPSWRISESLPATLASFDLVIFDEASQSDISALPALLRASKVLIVGDDKQVSPTAAFIEETKIRSLRMHYLDGQPFGALMLPGNSLYELALACYPGRRIMLREHFRCVEPIIGFSLQFYTEPIVPVRVPKPSERLSPPLIDVFVPNGQKDRSNCNHAEAKAIVDEIARIVTDPALSRRSIGVISLIGAKQALLIQTMLLTRIGEEAYIRHDIACGDSAIFQGKERDIILLSMVECPDTCTSKTALPFQQRFNVALSRARDREYLFHSVTEEMLKPDDLKAKVLRHFKNPMEGRALLPDAIALCESNFERDVFGRLVALGYRVHPQVKVGSYSIDLVVEGRDDRRLAIELDGDKYHGPERWADDLKRQRVMERVGWRFWRCWGSSYRLDPDACIGDLVRALDAMSIEPIGMGNTQTIWTEFRTAVRASESGPLQDTPDSPDVGSPTVSGASQLPTDISVEIGDRVQIQVSNESRVRVVLLTLDRHEPDAGSISVKHPSGAALIGAREDEEVEFSLDGRPIRWMVVNIEKASARS